MAPPGAIAHSRALLCPRASTLSLSSSVAPLSPLGLGVLGRGSVRSLTYFTTLRTQVRPAIEFVSGKEGLRPLFWLLGVLLYGVSGIRTLQVRLLALPEVRKRPWPLRRSRGGADGNGGRFVRSPCLLSWRGLRHYALHQMLSLCSLLQRQSIELPATTVGECRRRHSL